MRTAILGIGLYLLAQLPLWQPALYAQCPNRIQFHDQLRAFDALGSDSLGVEKQRRSLGKWLLAWRRCHPEADSSYVTALIKLAKARSYIAHYRNTAIGPAIGYARRAVAVYKNPSLSLRISDLAEANYRLGIYYQRDGEAEKAIDCLSKTIELGKSQPQAIEWANRAYPYVIYHYLTKGDLYKALLYADEGEKVAYRVGDDEIAISKVLIQKSEILTELGRFAEAKQAVEPAIDLIRKYPAYHQSHATSEKLLGRILREMGRSDESLTHYLRAYDLAKKNGHSNLSDFASALGQHYFVAGNNTKALSYYEEALAINKSRSRSVQLDNIALLHRRLKNYEQALKYHQEGLNEFSGNYHETDVTSLPTARLIHTQQQRDYFLYVVQDKANTWLDYAKSTRNDPAKLKNALRTYMLADTLVDFMRWEHSGQGSKLFWRDQTRAMYERAIQTCHLLDDPASALYFFEKSRAVLLSDKLNELAAGQRLTEEEAEREQGFREKINLLQGELSGQSPTDAAAASLRTQLLEAQQAQDDFVRNLEKSNPQYYRYKYDNRVPDLPDLRQKILAPLPGEGTFLSYFVGDSAVYGICVDARRVVLKQLDRREYEHCIAIFKGMLVSREAQNRDLTTYLKAAHGLYRTLVAPFEIKKGTKLIISPDGDFIPFAALSLSPQQPDYLVQHHAVSYTYSAGFLERSPRAPESWWPSLRTFLGMAPVRFADRLQQASLLDSDKALKVTGKHFFFAKNLMRQDATRRSFEAQAPKYRIVQLFTHADADRSRTEPTLYFADSVLRLSDLSSARPFRTQLLVLSACKTGIGQNQRGEGVFSLARGFAGVGIPSTLTTLWSVEDKAMYKLTELFYNYLTDCLPLDEALQKSQIEWLRTADRSGQLPYAWAGVVLVGQSAPLCENRGYFWAVVLLVVVSLVVGLVLFWQKRRHRPVG